jgi:hypothetical protein
MASLLFGVFQNQIRRYSSLKPLYADLTSGMLPRSGSIDY